MTRRSIVAFGLVVAYAFLSPLLLFTGVRTFRILAPLAPWITIIAGIGDVIIALLALRASGIAPSSIGWAPRALAQAVVWSAVAWILWGVVLGLLILVRPEYNVGITSIRSILVFYLFVGVPEELLFRGYILTWLRRFFQGKASGNWAALWAALVSSLLFALFHIPQRLLVARMTWNIDLLTNLAGVFFSGLFLAWLFLRSNNVWWVGLYHGGQDAPLLGLGQGNAFTDAGVAIVYLLLTEVMRRRPMGTARRPHRREE